MLGNNHPRLNVWFGDLAACPSDLGNAPWSRVMNYEVWLGMPPMGPGYESLTTTDLEGSAI